MRGGIGCCGFVALRFGGEGVQVEVHERVQFIDQGEYLEAIICPLCGSRLNIDYFSENDPIRAWWDEAIIKADENAGKGTFKLDDQCNLAMLCCQGRAQFTSLRFHSPAGFARFELPILNPGIADPLPEENMRKLEATLGCELVQVWARY